MLYLPQTCSDPKASMMHKGDVWTGTWAEYRGEGSVSHALSELNIVEAFEAGLTALRN